MDLPAFHRRDSHPRRSLAIDNSQQAGYESPRIAVGADFQGAADKVRPIIHDTQTQPVARPAFHRKGNAIDFDPQDEFITAPGE
jgi:hypothetical protein